MMLKAGYLWLLLLGMSAGMTKAQRIWTDFQGREVRATFEQRKGELVVLKKMDGSLLHIPLNRLSIKDQQYLSQWAQPKTMQERSVPSRDLDWSTMDTPPPDCTSLTSHEKAALAQVQFDWKYAETDHFYIHYKKGIYARKVARLAAFMYDYIALDIDAPKDRFSEKSHIYVFPDRGSWKAFLSQSQLRTEYAAYVRGLAMFVVDFDDKDLNSSIVSHEISHLVLNRFFVHRPPNWLNEGLAEWYGEFGRAAFKGIGKGMDDVFENRFYPMFDFEQMLKLEGYPEKNIHSFYMTAKLLIGYFRLSKGEEPFKQFLHDIVLHGKASQDALREHYAYTDAKTLKRAFYDYID